MITGSGAAYLHAIVCWCNALQGQFSKPTVDSKENSSLSLAPKLNDSYVVAAHESNNQNIPERFRSLIRTCQHLWNEGCWFWQIIFFCCRFQLSDLQFPYSQISSRRTEHHRPTPSVAEDLMLMDIMSSELRHFMVFCQFVTAVQCCAEARWCCFNAALHSHDQLAELHPAPGSDGIRSLVLTCLATENVGTQNRS